jgi:hypothetical protein
MIDATATVPAVLTIEIETLRTIAIDAMKTAKMAPTAMTEKVSSCDHRHILTSLTEIYSSPRLTTPRP